MLNNISYVTHRTRVFPLIYAVLHVQCMRSTYLLRLDENTPCWNSPAPISIFRLLYSAVIDWAKIVQFRACSLADAALDINIANLSFPSVMPLTGEAPNTNPDTECRTAASRGPRPAAGTIHGRMVPTERKPSANQTFQGAE